MPDVVGSIGSVISLAGKAWKLAQATKDIDLREAMVELRQELLSLKEQIVALTEERNALREELDRQLSDVPEVAIKGDLYFTDGGVDGPFCTACYDQRGKLIRATPLSLQLRAVGKFRCNACRAVYQGWE